MISVGNNEDEALKCCIKLSQQNPDTYVYTYAVFGLFASIKTKLAVFSPSDSVFDWYILNGKVKQFSSKQKIADQKATPTLY